MIDSIIFTVGCVGYLIWYGWQVFVKDKGNPGGLGLMVATGAILQVLGSFV